MTHIEGFNKYEVIDERFPLDKGDCDIFSYHVKEVLVVKYFMDIRIRKDWYHRHINGEFGWIREDTLDKYYMSFKTLPYKLEDKLDFLYLTEFDDYHEIRLGHERDLNIKKLLEEI